MRPEYVAWIAENVAETYDTCREVAEQMAAAFPELGRVRGHYYWRSWGGRADWWLVDEDGRIVDPTAGQFPSKGQGEYVPWIEGTLEPTGYGPNCGDTCCHSGTCCSDRCAAAYTAYCMTSGQQRLGTRSKPSVAGAGRRSSSRTRSAANVGRGTPPIGFARSGKSDEGLAAGTASLAARWARPGFEPVPGCPGHPCGDPARPMNKCPKCRARARRK